MTIQYLLNFLLGNLTGFTGRRHKNGDGTISGSPNTCAIQVASRDINRDFGGDMGA